MITCATHLRRYIDVADGNMLTNGSTWNTKKPLASAIDGVSIMEFKYDFMVRRVEKKVTQNDISKKMRESKMQKMITIFGI